MRRMALGRTKSRRTVKLRIIAFLLVIFIFVAVIDARIRPVIKTMASSQARLISTRLINEAVAEVLEDEDVQYEELSLIEKSDEGAVISMSMDTIKINELKANLTTAINDKMAAVDQKEIRIPIGTLIGGDLFTGRGYRIRIKLSLSGNVTTDILSTFEDAGINQTHHQIMLEVKASVYVLIPGYNTSTDVDTTITVAESVIVGTVPDAYTSVIVSDDETDEIPGIINDFGAIVD